LKRDISQQQIKSQQGGVNPSGDDVVVGIDSYILAPDLSSESIKTTTALIITPQIPKGIPSVILSNVDSGYFKILESIGFSEYESGWFVEASRMSEKLWKTVFGNEVTFSKIKAEKIIDVNVRSEIILPNEIRLIIESIPEDILHKIISTEKSNSNIESIRLAKKRALQGRVDYEDSWKIVKLAGLQHLESFPEDEDVLFFLQKTASDNNIDLDGIPEKRNLKEIFNKIIRDKYLTDKIKKVIPSILKTEKSVDKWAYIDIDQLYICSGIKSGGFIDVLNFKDEVDFFIFLSDNNFHEEVSLTEKETGSFVKRCSSRVSEVLTISEKESYLKIVDNNVESKQLSEDDTVNPIALLIDEVNSITDARLEMDEALSRIDDIHEQVDYLPIFTKGFVSLVINKVLESDGVDIKSSALMNYCKSFVTIFNNGTNEKDLRNIISANKEYILSLIGLMSKNNDNLFFTLRTLTRDPDYSVSVALGRLGEGLKVWFGDGFRIEPKVDEGWEILKVSMEGRVTNLISGTFSTYKTALEMLKYLVRKGNIRPVRSSMQSDWYAGYTGKDGAISIISDGFETEADVKYLIASEEERLMGSTDLPSFIHISDIDLNFTSEVLQNHINDVLPEDSLLSKKLMCNSMRLIEILLDLPEGFTLLDNFLKIQETSGNQSVWLDERLVFQGNITGNFAYAWSKALYIYLESHVEYESLIAEIKGDCFRQVKPKNLFDVKEEVVFRLMSDDFISEVIDQESILLLANCAEKPSEESEDIALSFYEYSKKRNAPVDTLEIVKALITLSSQHRSRFELSKRMKFAVRQRRSESDVFASNLSFSIWLNAKWSGQTKNIKWLVSGATNSHFLSVDYFPDRSDLYLASNTKKILSKIIGQRSLLAS
jgi:hypothetical protein